MRTLAIVITLTGLAVTAFAQGKGKGKGKGNGGGNTPISTGSAVAVSFSFGAHDRQVIQRWASAQPAQGLPPGLSKGGLPPGLQKHLARNGTLPPGLQKKITPFPPALVAQLPPVPAGCDYMFLDQRAMVVVRASNRILDITGVLSF
jgi:hypothetical protein